MYYWHVGVGRRVVGSVRLLQKPIFLSKRRTGLNTFQLHWEAASLNSDEMQYNRQEGRGYLLLILFKLIKLPKESVYIYSYINYCSTRCCWTSFQRCFHASSIRFTETSFSKLPRASRSYLVTCATSFTSLFLCQVDSSNYCTNCKYIPVWVTSIFLRSRQEWLKCSTGTTSAI